MALTLDPDGYKWDFESARAGRSCEQWPIATGSADGVLQRQGRRHLPRVPPTGVMTTKVVTITNRFARSSLTFGTYSPLFVTARERRGFYLGPTVLCKPNS